MHYDYNERMIYDSIEEYLKQRMDSLEQKREELKQKIAETSLFEKARNNGKLSQIKSDSASLEVFAKELFNLKNYTGKGNYTLPDNVAEEIQMLANALDSDDYSKVKLAINSSLLKENVTKELESLKEVMKNLENASNKADMKGKTISVHDGNKAAGIYPVNHLLDELYKYKRDEIINNNSEINIEKKEDIDNYSNRDTKFDDMIASANFSDDKSMRKVQLNYQKIKEYQIIQEKAQRIIERVDRTIEVLKTEATANNVDFNKVLAELNSIKKSSEIQLREAKAYLSKFDLSSLDKVLEEYNEKKQEQTNIEEYKQLSYDYEKAKQEGNLVKAEEIRQKMLAQGEKYNNDELSKMQTESKQQLYDDTRIDQIKKEEERKELENKESMSAREIFDIADNRNNQEIEEQREMIQYNYDKLKDLAIERLEQNGKEIDLERDQKLIENEIAEMVRVANMTPQQRAMEDGVTNPNDYNYYADSMMDFNVRDVRNANWEYQRNMNEQATNIYKEYIKYMAKTSDKDNAMKFSEFAARAYGYSNMTEEMIDEEVMDEVKGVSR